MYDPENLGALTYMSAPVGVSLPPSALNMSVPRFGCPVESNVYMDWV